MAKFVDHLEELQKSVDACLLKHTTPDAITNAGVIWQTFVKNNPDATEMEVAAAIMLSFKSNIDSTPMVNMTIPSSCSPNSIYLELNGDIFKALHEITVM